MNHSTLHNRNYSVPVIQDTCEEYVRLSQLGLTQLWRPRAYSPIWKAQMWSARWGPWWFCDVDAWVKSDVLLFPPAFVNTVFASSNMKCAPASDGWFGIDGYARLPLNLRTVNYTSETDMFFQQEIWWYSSQLFTHPSPHLGTTWLPMCSNTQQYAFFKLT